MYEVKPVDRSLAFTLVENGSDNGAWGLEKLIPYITKAADKGTHGRWTRQHILQHWMVGDWEMWAATKDDEPVGVIFGRIQDYPTGLKLYEIVTMAGKELKGWMPAGVLAVCKQAKEVYKCDRITTLTHEFVAAMLDTIPGCTRERDQVFEMSLMSLDLEGS